MRKSVLQKATSATFLSFGLCLVGCSSNDGVSAAADTGPEEAAVADQTIDHVVDQVVEADAPGFDVALDLSSDVGSGDARDAGSLPRFSFFVTSLLALQELSGSADGFGGDLRYGEVGPGAGLRGADKICAEIAERSMPGSSVKKWRAFLSVSADANGNPVNAIDRIGDGPWYDRLGRLLAPSKADLLHPRPQNGYAVIQNDLPNEDGVPNHQPDPTKGVVDNHHTMTGTSFKGKLYPGGTCKDWTSSTGDEESGHPRCGYCWPRVGDLYEGSWMSGYSAPGCAPAVELVGLPADPDSNTVAGNSGYGGFYCFALIP